MFMDEVLLAMSLTLAVESKMLNSHWTAEKHRRFYMNKFWVCAMPLKGHLRQK